MKLKDLNESVAETCDMPPKAVLRAQVETFRQLRKAVEGGERVQISGFGNFFLRETPAEDGKPATRTIRFKARDEKVARSAREGKAKRRAKAQRSVENPEGKTGE